MTHYKDKKIQKTSFADADFLARISEGLQYGVPVLVQDVEKIDPVMNSVLNKEVQKVGGRLVMQVGDKEIACNGELTLFMFTRDANAKFTPDLCSRVTFVNFTVTPSSLMSQCLNIYLKNEREEIDQKRTGLLKLQGEFKEKLRLMEEQLLDALNKAEGEILENDALIKTLESLKKESAVIAIEVAKTGETLEEIELVSNEYAPLSTMTTRIFFSLESMSNVHYLYQYSLQQFMDCVFYVLNHNEELVAVFLDAELQTLGVLEELGKDCIGIAQSSSIDAVVLQAILHQVVEPLEQLQLQQEMNVLLITGQIEIETCNQGYDERLFVQLLLSLVNLLLMILQ